MIEMLVSLGDLFDKVSVLEDVGLELLLKWFTDWRNLFYLYREKKKGFKISTCRRNYDHNSLFDNAWRFDVLALQFLFWIIFVANLSETVWVERNKQP